MKKLECSKCQQEMHQIPNVADYNPESQSAAKWNGITRYQCTNEKCENYEKFVEVRAGEDPYQLLTIAKGE